MGVRLKSGNDMFSRNAWSTSVVLLSIAHAYLIGPVQPLFDALTQPLWLLRSQPSTTVTDITIFLAIGLYYYGIDGLRPPQWVLETRLMELEVFAFLILLMIFAGLIAWRGEAQSYQAISERQHESPIEQLIPPLLLPGRTTHSRMFPQKHSFAYSYFSVGVPVNFKGCAGSMLSTNLELLPPSQRRKGWFDVNAADYLYRGGEERGLEARLRCYLRGEGVSDEAWSFAYLVTAPKFLGYSFNPVSFWYIYDTSKHLTMMVLEVNNTFGERRLYLLKAEEKATDNSVPDGFEAPAKATKFTNAWDKDFHVSPFNSRKGTYSLTAADPVAALKSGSNVLDNTVVLNSSKAHAKLVARVYSDGDHMDPTTMGTSQSLRLLTSWFWTGFLTFPRIITQAYKLYFKRKLHVWFRPEVLASSIGRTHTSSEATLEAFFFAYLGYLIDTAAEPVRLTYIPAGGLGTSITLTSKHLAKDQTPKELTLRILTPAFYTRFAHYSHTKDALLNESLHNDPNNRTCVIENAEHLDLLLSSLKHTTAASCKSGILDQYRWRFLQNLRSAPPASANPDSTTEIKDRASVQDTRKLPLSHLDDFILSDFNYDGKYAGMAGQRLTNNLPTIFPSWFSAQARHAYRDTVTKIFIADTYLFGFEVLIDVCDLLVRVLLVAVWFKLFAGQGVLNAGFGRTLFGWAAVNGVHLWDALKYGMRGIAAFLVFIFHLAYSTHDVDTAWTFDGKRDILRLPLVRSFYNGNFMVGIFFVLSGFALSHKAARQIRDGEITRLGGALSSSVLRRWIRLYVPCLCSALVILVALRIGLYEVTRELAGDEKRLAFHRERHAARFETLAEQVWVWATAFFRFANPFTDDEMYIDPHLWTIAIEYRASILLYVTQLGLCRLRMRFRLLSLLLLMLWAHQADYWPMILFYGGCVLAELAVRKGTLAATKNDIFSVAKTGHLRSTLCILTFICGLYLGGQPETEYEHAPGWTMLYSLIPTHVTQPRRYWSNWGSLLLVWSTSNSKFLQYIFTTTISQYLGKISFSLYLVHGVVIHTLHYSLLDTLWDAMGADTYLQKETAFVVSAVVVTMVVVWIADLFMRLVDVPSVRLARWLEGKCVANTLAAKEEPAWRESNSLV
ncbi:hypothetical protein E4T48_03345 [Aureobasidium sp. EXF-10727]|nr:hypothetical protein E4T48_03345 [Aureobasidium sp. EXF-10727]